MRQPATTRQGTAGRVRAWFVRERWLCMWIGLGSAILIGWIHSYCAGALVRHDIQVAQAPNSSWVDVSDGSVFQEPTLWRGACVRRVAWDFRSAEGAVLVRRLSASYDLSEDDGRKAYWRDFYDEFRWAAHLCEDYERFSRPTIRGRIVRLLPVPISPLDWPRTPPYHGFDFLWVTSGGSDASATVRAIRIPYWLFAFPCALAVARWGERWVRHVRRQRKGLCGWCGYDLHQSKFRCPECGMPMRITTPTV